MKKLIAGLLSAVMLLAMATVPTFAAGSQVSYYQTDSGKLKVFVNLGDSAYGNVMLTVFDKDNYDASTFASLSDEDKALLIEYSGAEELSGGVAEFEFGIDGTTGLYPYTVSVQYNGTVISGESFAYVASENDVLAQISDKTATELESYLNTNASLVFGNTGIYANPIKTEICQAMENTTYTDIETAFNTGYKVSLENEMDDPTSDADKITILTSYDDILAYTEPEYADFLAKDATFKNDAVSLITGEYTPQKLFEAVDLTALKATTNYSEVNPILTRLHNNAGVDLSEYMALTDTSAVDDALVGADYSTGTALQGAITTILNPGPGTPSPSNPPSPGPSGNPTPGRPATSVQTGVTEPEKEEKAEFSDLAGYDWAKPAIEVLAKNGVLNGKGEGKFAPSDKVSREELVKMLVCIFDIHDENATTNFADLKGHWSASYIASAEKLGLVKGVSKTEFGAGNALSREDMAVLCYRFMNAYGIKLDTEEGEDFADVKQISDYAQEAVKVLKGAKVINGKDNNMFAPKDGCSRAEAAKVVYYIFVEANR